MTLADSTRGATDGPPATQPHSAAPPLVAPMRPTPAWVQSLGPDAGDAGEDDAEAKRRRKEARTAEQAEKPVDPFLRYKLLSDTLDAEQDMVELADKKARLALVIMGALNAATLLVASRGGAGALVMRGPVGVGIGLVLAAYACTALFYFLQSIETLRPRRSPPGPPVPPTGTPPANTSMRVRYHMDILARSRDEYFSTWNDIRIDNVNAELVTQIYIVAGINRQKYAALTRLYEGLRALTVLVALLLVLMAAHAVIG